MGGEKHISAYVVEDETINRVVAWLYWEIWKSPFLKEKLEETLGIDTASVQWYEKLGQAMFALNIAGVESRYGEGEAKRFRDLTYRYTSAHGSEVQVLKSLQCWLYPCNEGDVVKKPLYRFFETIVASYLMSDIIGDVPDDKRAVWG